MKRAFRAAGGSDTALLWLACTFALCAGYYAVFGLLGTAVDRQREAIGSIALSMLVDARVLAQRATLLSSVRASDDRLRPLDLGADKATTVGRFVQTAALVAATHRPPVGKPQLNPWPR